MNNAFVGFEKLFHPSAVDDDVIIVFDFVKVKMSGDGGAAVDTSEAAGRQQRHFGDGGGGFVSRNDYYVVEAGCHDEGLKVEGLKVKGLKSESRKSKV